MTREEELNQAIDNMTNVIEAARYLFVEINQIIPKQYTGSKPASKSSRPKEHNMLLS